MTAEVLIAAVIFAEGFAPEYQISGIGAVGGCADAALGCSPVFRKFLKAIPTSKYAHNLNVQT
jgi:hypothetical protein